MASPRNSSSGNEGGLPRKTLGEIDRQASVTSVFSDIGQQVSAPVKEVRFSNRTLSDISHRASFTSLYSDMAVQMSEKKEAYERGK